MYHMYHPLSNLCMIALWSLFQLKRGLHASEVMFFSFCKQIMNSTRDISRLCTWMNAEIFHDYV